MQTATPNPNPEPGSLSANATVNEALASVLDRHTVVGSLWRTEAGKVRCFACGHRCLVGAGKRGICKVRFNSEGQLRVPFGYIAGVASDPVEKKPFFHLYPGSDALTFGMMGCDFHCSYCQNWMTSQALRDPASAVPIQSVTPEQLVNAGRCAGARLVVSSYNEPLITAEWAVSVFREAKGAGFACAFVSNGNATSEALDFLAPWIVAYKIDLKSFNDRRYRTLGGTLSHVTNAIKMVHERGLWLELVTLLVPGFNDSESELRELTKFIVSVSPDIPWHVTAFHRDYKLTDPPGTTSHQLTRAAEIGTEEGLRYVYAGNAPGRVGTWENTRCPGCGETLVARFGYLLREYRISAEGKCPACGITIAGVWPKGSTDGMRPETSLKDFRERGPRAVRLY